MADNMERVEGAAEGALASFDEILIDHAHAEKKAASTALSLLANYPEKVDLVARCAHLAHEEIEHFMAVHKILRKRGIKFTHDKKDIYAKELIKHIRKDYIERMTDRLIVAGLIEARSYERLIMLADALDDRELAKFYYDLAKTELGHAALFVELAKQYGGEDLATARLDEFLDIEAEIVKALPIQARIH